jgi:hypothetical protein
MSRNRAIVMGYKRNLNDHWSAGGARSRLPESFSFVTLGLTLNYMIAIGIKP